MSALAELALRIASNEVEIVDLTHTLDPDLPVIILPPEFGQCARFRMEEISAYDHRGPAWKWNNITMCEHTGTHFDAPSHWISGRDVPNGSVDEIPVDAFIGPVVVIDCSEGAKQNDDFELTVDVIQAWEAEHGDIPEDSWVLMRTDWSKRRGAEYLNMREDGPHSPGPTPEGLHGAGKYGLQCLNGLDQLPPTGAILIATPLKIKNGTGSPLRVVAMVEKQHE